ncbi:hypothetical protein B4102_4004 [Heyndrickxia sporothermodurans]|uniref:Uncharacterized protein n=1 Tax=Heyndrickxia sporothermodurans TaxID=46224 RepID=A0A150KML1_9BACI|nr:hypothetical protein B4102_4004 [Heyndrickxia sporothermodurans]
MRVVQDKPSDEDKIISFAVEVPPVITNWLPLHAISYNQFLEDDT